MTFKFEKLEVWNYALEYIDLIYEIVNQLPKSEENNLKSQMVRAATSIALNIAEGSTGSTDVEQARYLGMAIRSLLETVACQHIINRRGYIADASFLRRAYSDASRLAKMLQSMRSTLVPSQSWIREDGAPYHASLVEDDQTTE